MHTVVELPGFQRDAAKWMTPEAVGDLIAHLAWNPDAGVLIPGSGGFRKLRWYRDGMGKRGGLRVVYFYAHEGHPVFLAKLYAKNDKANLTAQETAELGSIAKLLLRRYGGIDE